MRIIKNEPMPFALWRDRLTLLLVALLPWQARYIIESGNLFGTGVPWEQGTRALFVIEIFLFSSIALHILSIISNRSSRKIGLPLWFKLALLLPIYALLSVLWARETTAALFTVLHLCEGYALAYLIWISDAPLTSFLRAFVVGAVSTAVLGLWQFLTQASFASTWLGVSAQQAQHAGVSVIERASVRLLRAYGTLPHPNILGGYLAVALVACAALVTQKQRSRLTLLIAVSLLSVGLVVSFSRSAWLASFMALVTAFVCSRAVRTRGVFREARSFLLTATGTVFCVALSLLPFLTTRLSFHGRLETRSVSERVVSIQDGLRMFSRSFATGVGSGNYVPAAFAILAPDSETAWIEPPHFVPLLVGAELGFFGLAVLFGFLFAWWHAARWLMRRTASPLAAMAATLPIVVIVIGCFDHYPFDLFAGTMLTGACFGFFLKAGEETAA